HNVHTSCDEVTSKSQCLIILRKGYFAHCRCGNRNASVRFDQLRDLRGSAALKRKHSQSVKSFSSWHRPFPRFLSTQGTKSPVFRNQPRMKFYYCSDCTG